MSDSKSNIHQKNVKEPMESWKFLNNKQDMLYDIYQVAENLFLLKITNVISTWATMKGEQFIFWDYNA